MYTAWARQPEGMRRAMLGPEAETMRRWLAFLRIAAGVVYLYAFASKVGGGFFAGLHQALQTFANENALRVTRGLLETVVIPHYRLFGWFVLSTEFLIGLLLLLGLGTRLVALAAVLIHLGYLVMTLGSDPINTIANGILIAALLVIFGTAGGWRWSLDEMIMNRR